MYSLLYAVSLKVHYYKLFRSSINGRHSINDWGGKNFLQKYFAEPYFYSCSSCCCSVLPSWGGNREVFSSRWGVLLFMLPGAWECVSRLKLIITFCSLVPGAIAQGVRVNSRGSWDHGLRELSGTFEAGRGNHLESWRVLNALGYPGEPWKALRRRGDTFGSLREYPGACEAFGSLRRLLEASGVLGQPSGAFGSLREPSGASGSLRKPSGASRSLREPG